MYKDKELIKEFEYIKLCCEYIRDNYCNETDAESIRAQINKAIRKNKEYRGFTFIKE